MTRARKFDIGAGLHCDVDRLIASRLLVQANSGGGKTRTLRRLLEQTHGLVQHLVIDPEGEYHTLRERFDYILAAPKGGDTVAHPRTAKLLAERLLQLGVSAILDIYELNPDARQAFVKAFLQALVDAPRDLWHPTLVVLDEAHVYAPEGKESDSTAAVKAMASRGRKRGFCLVPATQRLAKLSKDVAAECNNKLIGRCTLDVDIKRAAEELGFTTNEQKQGLRQLEPGQFYAFGPAFDVQAPRLVLVGGVTTRHPEPGQQAAPVPPPTDKVRKVLQQLADLPAEAEAREKSIEDLKRDNTQLRRQLTEAQKAHPVPPALKPEVRVIEKPVITDAQLARLEKLLPGFDRAVQRAGDMFRSEIEKWRPHLAEIGKAVASVRQPSLPMAPTRANRPAGVPVTGSVSLAYQRTKPEPASGEASVGNSGLRRMLIALAQRNGLARRQLGVRAGLSSRSGTFDTYLSKGRTQGWIGGGKDRIEITDAGLTALGSYDPLPEGPALLEHWLGELGQSGAARILRALADVYPRALSRSDLGEAAGLSDRSGTFDTYLSRLRTLELIEGRSEIKASAEFFEGA